LVAAERSEAALWFSVSFVVKKISVISEIRVWQ